MIVYGSTNVYLIHFPLINKMELINKFNMIRSRQYKWKANYIEYIPVTVGMCMLLLWQQA